MLAFRPYNTADITPRIAPAYSPKIALEFRSEERHLEI